MTREMYSMVPMISKDATRVSRPTASIKPPTNSKVLPRYGINKGDEECLNISQVPYSFIFEASKISSPWYNKKIPTIILRKAMPSDCRILLEEKKSCISEF